MRPDNNTELRLNQDTPQQKHSINAHSVFIVRKAQETLIYGPLDPKKLEHLTSSSFAYIFRMQPDDGVRLLLCTNVR